MFVIVLAPRALVNYETDFNDRFFRARLSRDLIIEDADVDDPYKGREVLYADDQASAELAAQKLASNNPGRDVYVSAPMVVYSSSVPEIIKKEITKEGILPF